jgi:hypothetical protein
MKLQLSNVQAQAFATQTGAFTSVGEATTNVLSAFAAEGHDPFTRRDVVAVIAAMAGGPEDAIYHKEDGIEGWTYMNPLIKANERTGRGYYTQGIKVGVQTVTDKVIEMAENGQVHIASKAGIAWNPVSLEIDEDVLGYYAGDAGLRRTAVEQTKCFGSFSEKAKVCRNCPLASFCAEARVAKLGEIAARLDAETEASLKAVLEPVEVEEEAPETTVPEGVETMTLPFEGVCSGCQEVMPEGSEGVFVDGSGLHHVRCISS